MAAGFLQRTEVAVPGELQALTFPGPEGPLEGLWKEADGPPAGSAVFAHPHPLHGGTLHNKVVYRAARALVEAGYSTLRFNFRGVGRSAGRYDGGRGEVDDVRAALAEIRRRARPPNIAGGFSFGAAAALRASAREPDVRAYIGVGLPLAMESGLELPRFDGPALYVTGADDAFGPPDLLRRFVGDAGRVVVIPQADHFLTGKLADLEATVAKFLQELPAGVGAP
jgi:alpha/beta superfamily hydrolase